MLLIFFFFKQKTAYEMRISDWSSDVCSSDLIEPANVDRTRLPAAALRGDTRKARDRLRDRHIGKPRDILGRDDIDNDRRLALGRDRFEDAGAKAPDDDVAARIIGCRVARLRTTGKSGRAHV